VFGKMQAVYQSDEVDDTSPYDETSSEREDKEEEDEEEDDQYTDAHVDRQSKSDVDQLWWKQLGPCTRRKGPVNYNEQKIISAKTSAKVCRLRRKRIMTVSTFESILENPSEK
jgi:hypothetical protein